MWSWLFHGLTTSTSSYSLCTRPTQLLRAIGFTSHALSTPPIPSLSWDASSPHVIACSHSTHSCGSKRTAPSPHAPGFFIAWVPTAPPISQANRCGQVVPLPWQRPAHLASSFEGPDVGPQTHSRDTFERTSLYSTPSYSAVLYTIRVDLKLLDNLFYFSLFW